MITGNSIGYLQRVDIAALQTVAMASQLKIQVEALPGVFCTPNRPLAWVMHDASGAVSDDDVEAITATFVIGKSRVFEQDPRFGLVVLSEIASRALSPTLNDPGSAIEVTGTMVRLFMMYNECGESGRDAKVRFDRVAVPELSLTDLFDDAFTGIARDGAGLVEVVVRLLKALEALAAVDDPSMRDNAVRHARLTLVRAEAALKLPEDITVARETARFAE